MGEVTSSALEPLEVGSGNGKITVKGGHLATIDEEKTALDAQRVCEGYLAR